MKTAPGVQLPLACLVSAALCFAGSDGQKTFASPPDAVSFLVGSIETDNYQLFASTVGPELISALATGDPVRDALDRQRFADELRRTRLKADEKNPNRMFLYVGNAGVSFPAPLIRSERGWQFDSVAGAQEIASRRIRRNESAAIHLCQQYLEAQVAYASSVRDEARYVFAEKIRATPGRRDGLYWTDEKGEEESPEGPFFAAAAFTELEHGSPRPYFGYYFKILAQQGPDAVGGSLDYEIDGALVRGFALVAWPAKYGVSGVKSFLVSHRGEIHEKDLGFDTAHIAAAMTAFNPDRSWVEVILDEDGERSEFSQNESQR